MDVPPVSLSDLLRHPDDLDKISSLKAEFSRKKAAVDSQLRGGLREQLETTQAGMNGLADGQKTVQQIKEEMMKIDKICSESQNMITDFATINLVSQAHRNFGAVETMRRNLETFGDRLKDIADMLAMDEDDFGNMPNLLPIHIELTKLRNIRDDAIEQITRGDDPSLQSTLEDYFERLDGVISIFDERITLIAMSLINLVVADNVSLVVRFALIVEAEESSDQRVLALQEALKDHKEIATRFQSITDGAKTVRGYKDKFLAAIKDQAVPKFEEAKAAFMEDPGMLEKSMKWYFNDLNTVKLGMVQLMPKKWKLFKTWTGIYHGMMHDFLVGIIDDPETSSAHTLEIVSWPEKYYRKMGKLGFKQEELLPQVIDNRETELVRDFRALIIKYLDQWIDRIWVQEKKDFEERNVGEGGNLDTDEYEYFRNKNMIDLWRMLREQLDAAANSKRADVVEGVVDAMFQRLRIRQQNWQKMLEDESARYENDKLGDLEGFGPLQDWLVATANDQIACIDDNEEEGRFAYLSDFKRKFGTLVTPQYMDRAEGEVAALRDGYVDLSTWCMTKFAQLVFAVDFKAVMPDFFTPKWYSSTAMARMIATFDEYVKDYKAVLHHSLVDIFIEIFADELLIRYLSSVRNKGAKFRRTDPFQDKIFDDLSTAFAYFDSLDHPDVGNAIKETWRVTELFLGLLTVSKEELPNTFEEFKTRYWDLQISWVEAVLRSRDDFERSMLNSVKARAAQMDVVRGPETIMGKVK
ncbi:exocyst complex component Sec6-domain-containing protein [Podospora australis]|uniref:Exocyst complex component Sec6-domain-containing protein n=1 Tax=Podospora australis TaxID=1536484 RepID=A0AAN7AIG6_9PEZI|nr:exocyst complex component Sec6-domain-containing protein [Podospora australis]